MMPLFERYSWHKKYRLLWAGAVLFCLLAYQLAIRPTLRIRDEYRAIVAGETAMQANLKKLADLRNDAFEIDHLLDDTVVKGLSGKRLPEPEQIVHYAGNNNTQVRKLPVPEWLGTANLRLGYTEYELEGRFIDLLKLLRDVERYQGIHTLGADFKKQLNPTSRTPELILKLRTVKLAENE
ncbi:hypothetical protein [Parapedobacter sp. 10938]|uniref:hypothetical protein n=1 Tax=Parapedobacter flavus TaxID=3110225 RepID=UPI002DB6BF40|nr:hypothetical protein [Parapedobacter sp. 10938]MEC3882003.1 hypothetical protein [Parapedobacter sp. 10938]